MATRKSISPGRKSQVSKNPGALDDAAWSENAPAATGQRRTSKVGLGAELMVNTGRRKSLGGGERRSSKTMNRGVTTKLSSGFAQTMIQAAQKINAQVQSLYSSRDENPEAKEEAPVVAKDAASSKSGNSSDSSEDEPIVEEAEPEEDLDDYDFAAAEEKVVLLLDKLKTEDRTDIMEDLSHWYMNKADIMVADAEELQVLEDDINNRDDELKDCVTDIDSMFESKLVREVKVLVKCNETLHKGATMHKHKLQKKKTKRAALPLPDEQTGTRTAFSQDYQLMFASSKDPNADSTNSRKRGRKKGKRSGSEQEVEAKESGEEQQNVGMIADPQAGQGTPNEKDNAEGEGEDDDNDDDDDEEDEEGDDEEDNASGGSQADGDKMLAEEDALNVEQAHKLLKEMLQAPQQFADSEQDATPGKLLKCLATVQDGKAELEKRCKLAKQSVELMRATVQWLAREVEILQTGPGVEREPNPMTTFAIQKVIDELTLEAANEKAAQKVEGANMSLGLDPEDLEDECAELEKLLARQTEEIELIRKQRERKLKMMGALLSQDNDDDNSGRTMQKSSVRDTRLEALMQGTLQAPPDMVQSSSRQITDSSPRADGMPRSEETRSDMRAQQLKVLLDEKDGQIKQAVTMLQRLHHEHQLLSYCTKKAQEGIDGIVADFEPPAYDQASFPTEDIMDLASVVAAHDPITGVKAKAKASRAPAATGKFKAQDKVLNTGTLPKQESSPAKRANQFKADGKDESTQETTAAFAASPMAMKAAEAAKQEKVQERAKKKEEAQEERQGSHMARRIREAEIENMKDISEKETAIKQLTSELQGQIAKDTTRLKAEKNRQKNLVTDISELKRQLADIQKADKSIPPTLEAMREHISKNQDEERRIRLIMAKIEEECAEQMRRIEQAKAEAQRSKADEAEILQASEAFNTQLQAAASGGVFSATPSSPAANHGSPQSPASPQRSAVSGAQAQGAGGLAQGAAMNLPAATQGPGIMGATQPTGFPAQATAMMPGAQAGMPMFPGAPMPPWPGMPLGAGMPLVPGAQMAPWPGLPPGVQVPMMAPMIPMLQMPPGFVMPFGAQAPMMLPGFQMPPQGPGEPPGLQAMMAPMSTGTRAPVQMSGMNPGAQSGMTPNTQAGMTQMTAAAQGAQSATLFGNQASASPMPSGTEGTLPGIPPGAQADMTPATTGTMGINNASEPTLQAGLTPLPVPAIPTGTQSRTLATSPGGQGAVQGKPSDVQTSASNASSTPQGTVANAPVPQMPSQGRSTPPGSQAGPSKDVGPQSPRAAGRVSPDGSGKSAPHASAPASPAPVSPRAGKSAATSQTLASGRSTSPTSPGLPVAKLMGLMHFPNDAKQQARDHEAEAARQAAEKAKAEQDALEALVTQKLKNEDLAKEIAENTAKLQALKKAMSSKDASKMTASDVYQIIGRPDEDAAAVKPPPEIAQLKKEIRRINEEIKVMRKRWWTDHKDVDQLAAKIRAELRADESLFTGVAPTETAQDFGPASTTEEFSAIAQHTNFLQTGGGGRARLSMLMDHDDSSKDPATVFTNVRKSITAARGPPAPRKTLQPGTARRSMASRA